MDSTYTFPKLRWPLDIKLHAVGDESALIVRCPIGVTEKPLLLIPAVAPILSHFDGSASFQSILEKFAPEGLSDGVLRQLISLLDENLFLSNSRFFGAVQSLKEEFASSSVRQAALAGLSYPSTPAELRQLVVGYLDPVLTADSSRRLACLVAPHIDYRRGGACYGKTYSRLAGDGAEVYVVIGTAHQYSPHLFHMCEKDFESPLGTLICARESVRRIANSYGSQRAFADQLLHRREHSLELQLPFMAHLRPEARIVPILVGSFHSLLVRNRYPEELDEYAAFAGALTEEIKNVLSNGSRVCIVAGVDMAHVGAAFGDSGKLSPERMEEIARRDCEYLGALERLDKKQLFDHVLEDQDARRICGFPTMYTVLDVMTRIGSRYTCDTVAYDQAVDYATDCAVTFAGLAFYQPHVETALRE